MQNTSCLKSALSFLSLIALFASARAHANLGLDYGYGPHSASLAGVSAPLEGTPFSSFLNPAAVADLGDHGARFGFGLQWASPKFKAIDGVVVENSYVSDKAARRGSVDTNYKDTLGLLIGSSFRVAPSFWNLSFGASLFLPINQIAYLDSGETFIPEYVLYRDRTQKPQFDLALALEPSPGFFVGLGAHVGFAVTGNAKVFLQTDPARASTARQAASLKPKLAPSLGLLYAPKDSSWSLGMVWRAELDATFSSTINSGTGLFTNYNALDVNFAATGTAHYDPMSLEIGTKIGYTDATRFLLQADYQRWSGYNSPALNIESSSGVIIATNSKPKAETKDLVIPRIAHEFDFESFTLRNAYSYRGSIFKDVPNGAGNALDPPRHTIALGAGIKRQGLWGKDVPWSLDCLLSYTHLATQTITKTAGNERGVTTDEKIGAPGYQAGGKIWGAGVSLSLAI